MMRTGLQTRGDNGHQRAGNCERCPFFPTS